VCVPDLLRAAYQFGSLLLTEVGVGDPELQNYKLNLVCVQTWDMLRFVASEVVGPKLKSHKLLNLCLPVGFLDLCCKSSVDGQFGSCVSSIGTQRPITRLCSLVEHGCGCGRLVRCG